MQKHVNDFDQTLHQRALFIHPKLLCIFITGSYLENMQAVDCI